MQAIETAAESASDPEVAENPFVFLMNQAKLESFVEGSGDPANKGTDDIIRLPVNFSAFNKQVEFPYETTPNAFKISPPEPSDSD